MLKIKEPLLFIQKRGNKLPFTALESSAFEPELRASFLEDVNRFLSFVFVFVFI